MLRPTIGPIRTSALLLKEATFAAETYSVSVSSYHPPFFKLSSAVAAHFFALAACLRTPTPPRLLAILDLARAGYGYFRRFFSFPA